MIDIVFDRSIIRRRLIKRIVEESVDAVFEKNGIYVFDISILITDDKGIKKINHEHRNIDRHTDVLSFPSEDDFSGGEDEFYGDIAISVCSAKRQAKEFGQSFEKELSFLCIHGCLHLLGFDHIDKNEEKTMRQEQRNILGYLREKKNEKIHRQR